MSDPDDKRDKPTSLPSPELNPLTNSVLGRHMGRWAEVYFTSPPEKREQAVQELLRQLELEPSAGETSILAATATGEPGPAGEAGAFSQAISLPEEEFVQCRSCGQIVLAEQKFCGTCGFSLVMQESGRVEQGRVEQGRVEQVRDEPARIDWPPDSIIAHRVTRDSDSPLIGEDGPTLFLDYRRGGHHRSHRVMAVALAILVATLFFVGARETAAWLRTHHRPVDVTAAAAPNPQAEASPTANPEVATPNEAAGAVSPAPNGLASTKQYSKTNPSETKAATDGSSDQKPTGPVKRVEEKLNIPGAGAGRGAEELAVAESYLHGTVGQTRDTSQAAQWLWKSVAKQNAAAALLLSDLYIRGDGVPQNCDQARLLLDAAARKGIPGAGERIRDLPRRGCQ